jgi:Family of unknown function (DUF6221)
VTGLASFLEARLAEDEAAANLVAADSDEWYVCRVHASTDLDPVYTYSTDAPRTVLAVRFDPSRVLREVAAGRKLLEAWALAEGGTESEGAAGYADGLRRAVEIRTSAYQDHPDYREEWRP